MLHCRDWICPCVVGEPMYGGPHNVTKVSLHLNFVLLCHPQWTFTCYMMFSEIIRVQRMAALSCDGLIFESSSPSKTRRRLIFSCDPQAERLLVVSQTLKAENKQTLSGVFVISPQQRKGQWWNSVFVFVLHQSLCRPMIQLSAVSSSGSDHCYTIIIL